MRGQMPSHETMQFPPTLPVAFFPHAGLRFSPTRDAGAVEPIGCVDLGRSAFPVAAAAIVAAFVVPGGDFLGAAIAAVA